ncbi:hypothetical protein SLEP1_g30274 [Rubroshorea leprosula]|uniref:Uncharacterized protein n=1 Tax=Rubroshorea leprosula TaxID=152421 RepID=A0AAV5KA29_9ROSI|nr:hypothetical protein SLEP1_g30274 [Rubroshorea leprosula]
MPAPSPPARRPPPAHHVSRLWESNRVMALSVFMCAPNIWGSALLDVSMVLVSVSARRATVHLVLLWPSARNGRVSGVFVVRVGRLLARATNCRPSRPLSPSRDVCSWVLYRSYQGRTRVWPRASSVAHARRGRRCTGARLCSQMQNALWIGALAPSCPIEAFAAKNRRARRVAPDRPPWGRPWAGEAPVSARNATWLILPVVICLSQRLSHACVSMN